MLYLDRSILVSLFNRTPAKLAVDMALLPQKNRNFINYFIVYTADQDNLS